MPPSSRRTISACLSRAVVVVIALLTVLATLTVPHAEAKAGRTATVALSSTHAVVGGTVKARGAAVGPRVRGVLSVDGVKVAAFRTSRSGAFSTSFSVPVGSSGTVTVRVTTPRASASAPLTVVSSLVKTSPPPSVSPSPSVTPAPVVGSDAPPPSGGYFSLEPVGSWSSLPDDAAAAAAVRRSSWEPRPQNTLANITVPSDLALGAHGGVAPIWNSWLIPRITGNFTGTTDEIIQWAALKWGLPDEVLRGQLVTESYWYQGLLDTSGQPVNGKGFGDYTTDQSKCAPGYVAPCPLSFGVLQVKYAPFHPGVFPWNRDSTAFNVDYVAAVLRGCYEGWESWLRNAGGEGGTATNYAAGDLDGCLGRWYAGQWHTSAAERYIVKVKDNTAARAWLNSTF